MGCPLLHSQSWSPTVPASPWRSRSPSTRRWPWEPRWTSTLSWRASSPSRSPALTSRASTSDHATTMEMSSCQLHLTSFAPPTCQRARLAPSLGTGTYGGGDPLVLGPIESIPDILLPFLKGTVRAEATVTDAAGATVACVFVRAAVDH